MKFKSNTSIRFTIISIILILFFLFSFIFMLWKFITNSGIYNLLFSLFCFAYLIEIIRITLSYNYQIEFRNECFIYKRALYQGVVYYKDIKKLYEITQKSKGYTTFLIKVKINKVVKVFQKDNPKAVKIADEFYRDRYLDVCLQSGLDISEVFNTIVSRL